ncbi:hypothetical protein Hanom_Chr02g00095821 [Helianthus anomalus]
MISKLVIIYELAMIGLVKTTITPRKWKPKITITKLNQEQAQIRTSYTKQPKETHGPIGFKDYEE